MKFQFVKMIHTLIVFFVIVAAIVLIVALASYKFYFDARQEAEQMPRSTYENKTLTEEMLKPLPAVVQKWLIDGSTYNF